MYKYSILFVSAIIYYAQCSPLSATDSESSSSDELYLITNDSTNSTDDLLTTVMSELESLDREIDDQFEAILPYLNFFFDLLLGTKSADDDDDDDDYINDMMTDLVPDETAVPPESNEIAAEKEDVSIDNPVSKPDVVSTLEKPANNSQTNS